MRNKAIIQVLQAAVSENK